MSRLGDARYIESNGVIMTRKKIPISSEIDRLEDAHYSGLGRRHVLIIKNLDRVRELTISSSFANYSK